MPLTKKGREIEDVMEHEYGKKKGEGVFFASANKGTIKGVEEKGMGGHEHYEAHHRMKERKHYGDHHSG